MPRSRSSRSRRRVSAKPDAAGRSSAATNSLVVSAATKSPSLPNSFVDLVVDQAEQKGTVRRTVRNAGADAEDDWRGGSEVRPSLPLGGVDRADRLPSFLPHVAVVTERAAHRGPQSVRLLVVRSAAVAVSAPVCPKRPGRPPVCRKTVRRPGTMSPSATAATRPAMALPV